MIRPEMNFPLNKEVDQKSQLAPSEVAMKRIPQLFKPYRWQLLGSIVLILIGAGAGMAMPFLLRAIVDDVLSHAQAYLLSVWSSPNAFP